jgi:hypothetical protein
MKRNATIKVSATDKLMAEVVAARSALNLAIAQTKRAVERAQKAHINLGVKRQALDGAMFDSIGTSLATMRRATLLAAHDD